VASRRSSATAASLGLATDASLTHEIHSCQAPNRGALTGMDFVCVVGIGLDGLAVAFEER